MHVPPSIQPIPSRSESDTRPAANGKVMADGAVQNGPYDSENGHLYVGFQPGTDTPSNAAGTYGTNTSNYDIAVISDIGAE